MEIKNTLKLLRKEKGMSQVQIAKLINKSQQAYSKYEKGIAEPDFMTLDILSKFYNVPVSYILGETNIRNTENSNKKNTIVVFGRNEGKSEYQVNDEQLKAMKTLLDNMKNLPDEDNF